MVRPRTGLQFGVNAPEVPQRYHCSPPWNPVRRIFGAVERKLAVGQPSVGGDRGGRRHFLGDGLGHVLGEIHHVVGRQLGQFARGPAFSGYGLLPFQSALLWW